MFSDLNSNDKFWLLIWAAILSAFVLVTGMIATAAVRNSEAEKKVISEMIAKGQNPMLMKCLNEDLTTKGSLSVICASVVSPKPAEPAASN